MKKYDIYVLKLKFLKKENTMLAILLGKTH